MLIFFSHLHLGLPNGLFPSVFPTKYPVYASPLPHTRRERCRPQMTTWRIRISCWIPKATETHSEYIIFIAFALQRWLRERTSLLRYTYIACLGTLSIADLETDKYRVIRNDCRGFNNSPGHLVLQMQPHVISFCGVTSSIRFMFLLFPQVSRN